MWFEGVHRNSKDAYKQLSMEFLPDYNKIGDS